MTIKEINGVKVFLQEITFEEIKDSEEKYKYEYYKILRGTKENETPPKYNMEDMRAFALLFGRIKELEEKIERIKQEKENLLDEGVNKKWEALMSKIQKL